MTRAADSRPDGFTAEEKAAMKERARELKAEGRRVSRGKKSPVDGDAELLAKVATMEGSDRAMAERLHALIKSTAPELESRLWYGMPAYTKDGKVLCYFQDAGKFKTRYATFGFSDKANLDEDGMWPTAYALKEMTGSVEADIAALVKRAVS